MEDPSNFIHNYQKMETTQGPISSHVNKQIVVYPHNGVHSAMKKSLWIKH